MKRLLICIVFALFGWSIQAQNDFEKETIRLLPESELIISGSTNVNKFHCEFDIDLISDSKQVKYLHEHDVIKFSDLQLNLLTKGFDCGNKKMNSDFQDLLKSDSHPQIVIDVVQVRYLASEEPVAEIRVELAGQTNYYRLPVSIHEQRFKGKFSMNIRDFGLEPPKKALGLIIVDEHIEVAFDLKLAR